MSNKGELYCEKIRGNFDQIIEKCEERGGSTMILIYPNQDIMNFSMK